MKAHEHEHLYHEQNCASLFDMSPSHRTYTGYDVTGLWRPISNPLHPAVALEKLKLPKLQSNDNEI